MDTISEWIETTLNLSPDLQVKLFYTALIILLLMLVRFVVTRVVARRTDNPATIYAWRKGVEYVGLVIGLLLISRVWFTGSGSFVTYLGLLSAGLAIALQDPITNLIGWLFIVSRRPFEMGDRIEIDGVAGDVVDIRYFQFTLLEIRNWVDADQSTGRLVHVPNRLIFSHPVASFTGAFEFIWNEINVLITFESDWRLAKRLLQEIAERHSAEMIADARSEVRKAALRIPVRYDNLSSRVYTKVLDSGVLLTIRHVCNPRHRRAAVEMYWEDILDVIAEHDSIDLAYPTQRIYYQSAENDSINAAVRRGDR
ncbi:MAG: mechanosensitive ion channel family protein [Anaerolineae bacterium]|nr:mechanosensitive ion channel family protein [Anaerolineae bacterium]MCO5189828.1 mechanosensitive ion channel family protein [Anaerolineae bacterium]MCO5192754.1 mechanosensitive ion channel family protein [Anaerolineae bacterium]MCO5197110.1 mechanosensitive ion channel family protein [Anaerolineae bacterium]